MRRHVRSWRKQTLHRHRNVVRKGQRIAALDDMLVETIPEALASRARSPLGRRDRRRKETLVRRSVQRLRVSMQ
jgi:hypothetical protein